METFSIARDTKFPVNMMMFFTVIKNTQLFLLGLIYFTLFR
jgi:hypothetical protein